MPDLPCGKSLKQQHFESVFDLGSGIGAFLHEECDIGVVEEIVAEMMFGQQILRNVRAFVDVGVHAEGSGVDDDFMGVNDIGRQIGVGDHSPGGSA